ncbi:MAG: aspartate--ammonia ligase [Clostridia bacterium]|nr:aspartate--ammonia ligase [Clostridia bacterium]
MKYQSVLGLIETEVAIKFIKDTFERELAKALKLTRVSAPLFVQPESGLNDNLNGYERAVRFDVLSMGKEVEIVQSLAKWKRNALAKYGFEVGTGLYTDMNAIRRDEDLDRLHSVYVDQWDWEKIISKDQRKISYLKKVVKSIYKVFLKVSKAVNAKYPQLTHDLPKDITFISTKELEQKYPDLPRKEREHAAAKEYGAIFLYKIGWPLKDGKPHDGRAADYDDWKLNGDLILWYDVLGISVELSSMGIRVDKESLVKQLKKRNEMEKLSSPYCQDVLNDRLPLTIGGGIGQSRICMYFLKKAHIGEVQSSVWPEECIKENQSKGINLL